MSQSSQTAVKVERPESFQIKGGLFPMTLIDIKSHDLDQVLRELSQKVKSSPAFFQHSPVVFGLESFAENELNKQDLEFLINTCKSLDLIPVATRGIQSELEEDAIALGLANLKAKNKSNEAEQKPIELKIDNSEEHKTSNLQEIKAENKVIEHPVRSGQQIYAPGGDLIILSSVSAGAEVLADGNIHIYGALRGRALAGVRGNSKARIFCASQEAELISIAGEYLVDETLKQNHWKNRVQVLLSEGTLSVLPLN